MLLLPLLQLPSHMPWKLLRPLPPGIAATFASVTQSYALEAAAAARHTVVMAWRGGGGEQDQQQWVSVRGRAGVRE
jgi:hypothetical protein